jgi:hypothetical protein
MFARSDFKYFNDLHVFNAETHKWMKLDVSGIPPSPRSGDSVNQITDNQVNCGNFGLPLIGKCQKAFAFKRAYVICFNNCWHVMCEMGA